jgi:hypothetical protein
MTLCLLLYIIAYGMLKQGWIIIILCGDNAHIDYDTIETDNVVLLLFRVLCLVSGDISYGMDLSRSHFYTCGSKAGRAP